MYERINPEIEALKGVKDPEEAMKGIKIRVCVRSNEPQKQRLTMVKNVKITVVYEGTIPEDVTEEQLRERVCENLDDWFWSSEWNDDTKEDTIVERKDIKIEIE